MTSSRHKRYLRRVFDGENGDIVKNILTDGQWKPSSPGGCKYQDDSHTLAAKVLSWLGQFFS